MKKLVIISLSSIFLLACKDSKLEKLEAKLRDTECKTERMNELRKNDAILIMATKLDLGEEYMEAYKSFGDSLIPCRQAIKKWEDFMKKYDSVLQASPLR